MTLKDVINYLESTASVQPAVHTIVRNDILKLNNASNVIYGVFAWVLGTQQVKINDRMATYQLYVYYIDRLAEKVDNTLDIHSFGIQVLNNILLTLQDVDIFINDYSIQPFYQRFADECAGVYATINIDVPIDYNCSESYTQSYDYNNDYNGGHLAEGIKII